MENKMKKKDTNTDPLLDALREDYIEMHDTDGTEFKEEEFESYLDKVFQDMSDRFMQIINDRKDK